MVRVLDSKKLKSCRAFIPSTTNLKFVESAKSVSANAVAVTALHNNLTFPVKLSNPFLPATVAGLSPLVKVEISEALNFSLPVVNPPASLGIALAINWDSSGNETKYSVSKFNP